MRATIRDLAVFAAVRPLDLTAYLRTRAWRQTQTHGTRSAIWEGGPAGQFELLVPLEVDAPTYGRRVADVFRLLAEAEGRSQMEILRDVTTAGFDIVRIRALAADYDDGTVPLDVGVTLVDCARDLLLAAACAAHQPRPVYHARKPAPALDYLRRARLGQTEHGSFVIALHAPVPPALQMHLDAVEEAVPYERRVTTTLLSAAAAARRAVQAAAASGDFKPFEEAVADGVSANFCDALAGLHAVASCDALALSVDWAAVRPMPTPATPPVVIGRDALGLLREASRLFKQQHPEVEGELTGYVTRLEREEGDLLGTATVVGAMGSDPPRRVRLVELPAALYDRAVEAHKSERRVRAVGDLRKDGRTWVLRGVREFEAIADEADG